MTALKPSFKWPLWITRAGIYFLFPPLFLLELPIGFLITSPFGASEFTAGLVGYCVSVCAAVGIARAMYRGTTFEICPTSVIHNLDFLWSKRKEILLVNIKEVELNKGFLQRFFGLGTLVIHTQASTSGNTKTELSFFDVENSNQIYALPQKNVSKENRAQAV